MRDVDEPLWRQFQDDVASLFKQIPGCTVHTDWPVHGARIGTVQVDVLAEFRNPRQGRYGIRPVGHRFVFRVVVECKHWNRPIPQEKVFALKTIVEDVGAALGVIVCEPSVQRGVKQYLEHPINLIAVTLKELEHMVSGTDQYQLKCSECGADVTLPFAVAEGRPAYCRDCYAKAKPRF